MQKRFDYGSDRKERVVSGRQYHSRRSPWIDPIFKNFEILFKNNSAALQAIRNTVLLNLLFISVGTIFALALSLAFNEIQNKVLKKITQSFSFLPYFISTVVVGIFVSGLLGYDNGVINRIITMFGGEKVAFYMNASYWPVILLIVNIWKGAGYSAVVYLATISGIDSSYYEAAKIDGATRWQQTWYFPDAFGNAGQMPQVLKQAGMEAIAFGRGVKPVGLNNEVNDKKDEDKRRIAFAVLNLSGWKKTQVIIAELDAKRIYGNLTPSWNTLEAEQLPKFALYDTTGNKIEAKITKAPTAFGYDLPDDRFRQPYMAERVQVTFEAEDVPAIGYKVYVLEEDVDDHNDVEATATAEAETTATPLCNSDALTMENKFVRVQIHPDGSFALIDKKTNHTFDRVGVYEDTGDMGNEYIYIQDTDRQTITTANLPATITVEENREIGVTVKIRHELMVPAEMGDEIWAQRYSCVDLYQRKAGRSTQLVPLSIDTVLTLEHSAKGVKVKTTVVNTAKDHRLRVLIPTGLASDTHMADSTFEVVRRPNRHGKAWTNPSACEHQQCFVAMEDASAGILAANRGLYEYEILPDQENTIAITLLRAVAEMGDWGYFPTPQAQMQGTYTMEYALFPYEPGKSADAFALGYGYQHDLVTVETGMNRKKETIYLPQAQVGKLPLEKSFFEWQGEGLNLTAWKKGAHSNDIFVRFVNTMETQVTFTIKKADWMKGMYRRNNLHTC